MSQRITGGEARGRVSRVPVPDGVRPTSERVREALFSVLGQELDGARVLDAFGGTGMLGFEAWSRGATVTIVERERRVLDGIRARAAAFGAEVNLVHADVLRWAGGTFDGVLADPPWASDPAPMLDTLTRLAGRWLVFEAEAGRELPPTLGALALDRPRAYGRTALWVYRA